MAVTKDDLQDFHRFADEKINQGTGDSLIALVGEWEALRREIDETVADIHQSHADIEAGKVASVADTFDDVRSRLGKS